ncbi:MAG: hypothetical protein PHS17_16470, partial [Desulfobacterales bacterium]|nr:hypothetical protein [Desulfobacterales bacterium]
ISMPCKPLKFGDGVYGFVCSRGDQRQKCKICGMPATKLCDFVLKNGKTCDMPLCARHAHSVGPEKDYCPAHHDMKARLEQKGEARE